MEGRMRKEGKKGKKSSKTDVNLVKATRALHLVERAASIDATKGDFHAVQHVVQLLVQPSALLLDDLFAWGLVGG